VLDWDSAQFGFPVARVRSSVPLGALEGAAEQMRKRGIVLAYLSIDADLSTISDELLFRLGGRLVDQRVTYVAELISPGATDPKLDLVDGEYCITKYHSTAVVPSLTRLARESGAFSRFRLDPQIASGVFERIYDAWIRRSVNHEIADEVLVARKARRITGFVSVRASGIYGEIGLLAVDASSRGHGLGRRLVREARSNLARRGCTQARATTQRANLGSCALYESAGYMVRQVERVYHLWLLDFPRNSGRPG
jgi:dTDP-4-amino-4,6-dideoxy-D-galactose acyltransferase